MVYQPQPDNQQRDSYQPPYSPPPPAGQAPYLPPAQPYGQPNGQPYVQQNAQPYVQQNAQPYIQPQQNFQQPYVQQNVQQPYGQPYAQPEMISQAPPEQLPNGGYAFKYTQPPGAAPITPAEPQIAYKTAADVQTQDVSYLPPPYTPHPTIVPVQQGVARATGSPRQNRRVVRIVVSLILLLIAVGVGAGVGVARRRAAQAAANAIYNDNGNNENGGTYSDCTPPGGQECETSGDCSNTYSSCIMACNGFSYCT